VVRRSVGQPHLLKDKVLERLAIVPAVGAEIASINGQDPAMSEMFGQDNQRGIGKIHRPIGVPFHQFGHSNKMMGLQLENNPWLTCLRNCDGVILPGRDSRK
jgi:hypothetical protein